MESFSFHRIETKCGLMWAVAGEEGTSVDVCKRVGIIADTPNVPGSSGIVLKVDEYYGVFDKALWQKIDHWQSMSAT